MTRKNEKYVFISKRIGYRLPNKNDFDNYLTLDGNPKVREFFASGILDAEKIKAKIKTNIEFFKMHGFGDFVAIELNSGEFIGRCGFGKISTGEIEIGYVFLPEFWGKGFATEAVTSLLQWASQHITSVNTIIAFAPVRHFASLRVMEKAGMVFYKKDTKDGQECVFYKINLR